MENLEWEIAAYVDVDTGPIEPFYMDTVGFLVEFVGCLKSGGSPETSGRDHLKTLVAVLFAVESFVTGKKIFMGEFMETMGS